MPERFSSDSQVLGPRASLYPYPIGFDPSDRAHLARVATGELVFRVSTPSDFSRVLLVIRDQQGATAHGFELIGAAGEFALWELRIRAEAETIEYSLALETADGTAVYFSPTGITNAIERNDRFVARPSQLAAHDVPDWVVGAPIYQIFPDRFSNGDPSNDPANVRAWHLEPTRSGFQGGDLFGVGQQADYLAGLGMEAVYLNPIFASPSTHRYDTRDYLTVDPLLGGADSLHLMVKELHARRVAVILDISINHTHPRWAPFADVVANGQQSRYADWFVVHEYPIRVKYRPHLIAPGTWPAEVAETLEAETGVVLESVHGDGPVFDPTYDAWYGVPTMPRINLENRQARNHMLEILRFWIEEFDVDGWRLDVARYVDHDVWPQVREVVRAAKADTFLLAEIMGDTSRWLQGDEFDATMNYTFRHLCVQFFARRHLTTEQFVEGYLRMLAMYSPEVIHVSHNLVGSHDTPRFYTAAGADEDRLRLATFFQMTVPGAPGLYYGDELASAGEDDPFCRGTFAWDQIDDHPLVEHLRRLGQLRKSHPALRRGEFRLRSLSGDLIAFERVAPETSVTVVINTGEETRTHEIAEDQRVLATSGQVDQDGSVLSVRAMSGVVVG